MSNSNYFSLCLYLRYLDAYLKTFLTSAEKHFMVGLHVTYYVFTDLPEEVPNIELAPNRSLKVIPVEKHSRWQDISMMRMKMISDAIESEIRHHCNYIFCLDVDQEFKGRFGSEALGESVALQHAWYYKLPKHRFTYDRRLVEKCEGFGRLLLSEYHGGQTKQCGGSVA